MVRKRVRRLERILTCPSTVNPTSWNRMSFPELQGSTDPFITSGISLGAKSNHLVIYTNHQNKQKLLACIGSTL